MSKSLIDLTNEELNEEYDRLFERLENMPNDLRLFPRIRDRARSLLNLAPENRVTSVKRLTLERRLDAMEREMLSEARQNQ
jgi:hypothetical protein